MVKWWSDVFSDLKHMDVISYENLLERSYNALAFYDKQDLTNQVQNGRAFIGVKSSKIDDHSVNYFHSKYNSRECEIPTASQIVLRQFRPDYSRPEYNTQENTKIFDGETSNVNNRDGHIIAGFSVKSVEAYYINLLRTNQIIGDWLYFEMPYELIYDNVRKSINNAPLGKAIDFIEEVDRLDCWEDSERLRYIVETYDTRFPNWSHDFPIKSFLQVRRDGMLFPTMWFNFKEMLSEGTHKLVMSGYNKFDVPCMVFIPKFSPYKWYSISKTDMFLSNGEYKYLGIEVDRFANKVEYSFVDDPHWAHKKNVELGYKHYEQIR